MMQDLGRTRNDDSVRMIKQMMEIGPQIGEVARRVEVFKETLRYRFHKHLIQRGFVVRANIDYQKIGLKRMVIIARVAPVLEHHAEAMMSVLSEACYLTGLAETTLEGMHVMQVTVPGELREECLGVYTKLLETGVFSDMLVLRFEEVRSVPMKPEYYDFSNGTWAYDWHSEKIAQGALAPSRKVKVEKYDLSDLLILNELDKGANQTLVEIAKKLSLSHKLVLYHYRSHVLSRGLITNYRIVWHEANYDTKTQSAEPRRRPYLQVALLVRGASDVQRSKLRASVNQIPFLEYEASDPDYYAQFFIPLASYIEFLRRIRELNARAGTTSCLFVLDQRKASEYAMACGLYDRERGWQLNGAEVLKRVESVTAAGGPRRGA